MSEVRRIAESLVRRIINDIFFEIGEIIADFPSGKDKKRQQDSG